MGQKESVCTQIGAVSKDEYDLAIEPLDVLIFSREEDGELAGHVKDALQAESLKVDWCNSSWKDCREYYTMEKSKCLIYVIGEEYIEDDVGSNVAWAAHSFKKPSFIVCPKEKHMLWDSIPTGSKIGFNKIKWFVLNVEKQEVSSEFIQEINTATNIQTVTNENANESTQISNPIVEDIQPKIMDSEKGITEPDIVTSATPIEEKTQTRVEADGGNIPPRKLDKFIDEITLCGDLEKVAAKWDSFGMMVIEAEEVDKIRANNIGKESVVAYCFNRVITTWLKGKKQYRTKEILIEALKTAHQPGLAAKVAHDPNFEFSQVYLQKLLKPIKYKYCEFGIQLGLQFPKIKEDEVIRGDCDYCLTMVIMKWFENHPKKKELWDALECIGEEGLKEDLQEKYEDIIFPGDVKS